MPRKRVDQVITGSTPDGPSVLCLSKSKKARTKKQTDDQTPFVKQVQVQEPASVNIPDSAADLSLCAHIELDKTSSYCESLAKTDPPFCWHGAVVLPNCDDQGVISDNVFKRKYCLLQPGKTIRAESNDHCVHSFIHCSCDAGLLHRDFVSTIADTLSDDEFDMILQREEKERCKHVIAAYSFLPVISNTVEELDDYQAYFIRECPLLAVTYQGGNFGLIQRDIHRKLVCQVCTYGVHSCVHIDVLKKWCNDVDIDWDGVYTGEIEDKGRSNSQTSISTNRIPFPLTQALQERYKLLSSNFQNYPAQLIPSAEGQCVHGHSWDICDPVTEGWSLGPARIYRMTCTISQTMVNGEPKTITVFYRRTLNNICDCQKYFDGQDFLLFNVNNKVIIDYGLLFAYLYMMSESRNPLAAFHRAYAKTVQMMTNDMYLSYDILRLGWNDFSFLMDVDWQTLFKCEKCGPVPNIVVCDGTSLGFKKTWKKSNPEAPVGEVLISGIPHEKWAYIHDASMRKLLLRFSGSKKGLKSCDTGITEDELDGLVRKLRIINRGALAKLLSSENCKMLPAQGIIFANGPFRPFLEDLARNTPIHALFQGVSSEAIGILQQTVCGLDILQEDHINEYARLSRELPIILKFLVSTSQNGKCSRDCLNLTGDILAFYKKSYQGLRCYTVSDYGGVPDTENAFFPNMKAKHGLGNYRKDGSYNVGQSCRDGSCKKFYVGHPTLTPGIFTIFCIHGICYGFVAMESFESPRVPFDIFLRLFEEAPKLVIYDNACKLHQYVLNREPDYFSRTTFVCDRMHWRNHVGCSSGYDLDMIKWLDTKSINTQVNEQANAGLKRLKGQTSYMNPERFMSTVSLFLALRNKLKKTNN